MTARRVLAVCLLAAVMGSLVGCVPVPGPRPIHYTQNRTVDVPSLKPASAAWMPPYWSEKGGNLHNFGEPFHFTDPRPRVLVIGHVQVLRDNSPSEAIGAILFKADDYDDNLTSLYIERKSEAVTFVSGDWFAGNIFTGKRRIYAIYISEQPANAIYVGCFPRGLRHSVGPGVGRLNMDDVTKAYYLGHITIYEKPRESFPGYGHIRVEVRDRADEFAGSIRANVGDRGIEKALLPNCPE